MSEARRALINLLYGERPTALRAVYEPGGSPEREKDADAILALHAHELAEKQREYAEEEWTGSDARMTLRRRVARHLADLIDPEVSG